ncbi:hypothetical protein DFAR_3180021 [Desulfarculales bacterium]
MELAGLDPVLANLRVVLAATVSNFWTTTSSPSAGVSPAGRLRVIDRPPPMI